MLEYLSGTDCHPTADDIGHAVNERFPTVSRASVYNVLHSLRSSGLVREVVAGNAVTRYDANTSPHHHFVCQDCGRIEDVAWDAARVSSDGLSGRTVDCYEVIFHGRCAACKSS